MEGLFLKMRYAFQLMLENSLKACSLGWKIIKMILWRNRNLFKGPTQTSKLKIQS
jgi:hypothetical protein